MYKKAYTRGKIQDFKPFIAVSSEAGLKLTIPHIGKLCKTGPRPMEPLCRNSSQLAGAAKLRLFSASPVKVLFGIRLSAKASVFGSNG